MSELEQKLYAALLRIAAYDSPSRIRRDAEKCYGLNYEEALEMSYENISSEAKRAIKGIKKPNRKEQSA